MGNVLGTLFGDIAKAIRSKTGESGSMKPGDFAERIAAIDAVSGADEYNSLIDEINGEVVNGGIVTFIGLDGSTLCQVSVAPGYNCPNPAVTGLITKPTKEATESVVYTFSGWSLTEGGEADETALLNITEDRTVYVAFAASTRCYTVNFYDGEKLLKSQLVEYGGSVEYPYKKTGHYFNGWLPEPANITQDTDCYAQLVEASFWADDWETIIANAESGKASEWYAIGEEKEITLRYDDGSSENVILQIVGIDVDRLTSGKTAGLSIIAKTALRTPQAWTTTEHLIVEGGSTYAYTRYGFEKSDLKTYLQETVRPALPRSLRESLKVVEKHYEYYYGNTFSDVGYWDIWIPSAYELTGLSVYNDGNRPRYLSAYPTTESRIVTLYNGEAVKWWTTNTDGAGCAECIDTSGKIEPVATSVYGPNAYVVFGFCV